TDKYRSKSSAFFGEPAVRSQTDELDSEAKAARDFWHGFEARLRSDEMGNGGLPPVDVLTASSSPPVAEPEIIVETDNPVVADLLASAPEEEHFQPVKRQRLPRFARSAEPITEADHSLDELNDVFEPLKLPAFNPEQLRSVARNFGVFACVLI